MSQAQIAQAPLAQVLSYAVFAGFNIPAHDETLDLAEEIGVLLEKFRAYVSEVRSPEQGKAALAELLAAAAKAGAES